MYHRDLIHHTESVHSFCLKHVYRQAAFKKCHLSSWQFDSVCVCGSHLCCEGLLYRAEIITFTRRGRQRIRNDRLINQQENGALLAPHFSFNSSWTQRSKLWWHMKPVPVRVQQNSSQWIQNPELFFILIIHRIKSNKSCCLQVLIPFPAEGSLEVEQNVDLPDYLPEDESPSQEPDKAVTRVGNGQDGNSWLGAATNFLSRSFYWWSCETAAPSVNLPTNQNPPAATSHRCLSELERQNWDRASNSERDNMKRPSLWCCHDNVLLSQVRRADSGVSLKSDDVLSENGSICSNQIVLTDRMKRAGRLGTFTFLSLIWLFFLQFVFEDEQQSWAVPSDPRRRPAAPPSAQAAANSCCYYWFSHNIRNHDKGPKLFRVSLCDKVLHYICSVNT